MEAPLLRWIVTTNTVRLTGRRVGCDISLDNEMQQIVFDVFVYKKTDPIHFRYRIPYSKAKPKWMQDILLEHVKSMVQIFNENTYMKTEPNLVEIPYDKYTEDSKPVESTDLGTDNQSGSN